MPAAQAAEHEVTISLATRPRQACNGVSFMVLNTADRAVLLTGLSLFGDPGRVRIYTMKATDPVTICRRNEAVYDWRRYMEIQDLETVPLTFSEPVRVPFRDPVPISPGEARRIYVYSYATDAHGRQEGNQGIAYRRFRQRLCVENGHIACRMAEGNFGGQFRAMEWDGIFIKLQMVNDIIPAGILHYQLVEPSSEEFTAAHERFSGLVFTLADFSDAERGEAGIGPTNRHLIDEWKGRSQRSAKTNSDRPNSEETLSETGSHDFDADNGEVENYDSDNAAPAGGKPDAPLWRTRRGAAADSVGVPNVVCTREQ
jgi:hypothetical protein